MSSEISLPIFLEGSHWTVTAVSLNAFTDEIDTPVHVSEFHLFKGRVLERMEGNIFILSDENSTGQKLPDWSYNVQNSNDTGLINIMYLDMTGGKNAFTKELLADDLNVVLRLKFRLRGSVRPGDVLDLILEDAVFAASDEPQSLAMTTDTLKVKNGRLVIGE